MLCVSRMCQAQGKTAAPTVGRSRCAPMQAHNVLIQQSTGSIQRPAAPAAGSCSSEARPSASRV
jgi:hypothetical protein